MASKSKRKVFVEMWTREEEAIANRILAEAKKHTGTFLEKYGMAAQVCGYERYGALPLGVKAFIAHLGGKNVKRRGDARKLQEVDEVQISPTLQWYKEIESNPSLRHGLLHPEDDSILIEHFSCL